MQNCVTNLPIFNEMLLPPPFCDMQICNAIDQRKFRKQQKCCWKKNPATYSQFFGEDEDMEKIVEQSYVIIETFNQEGNWYRKQPNLRCN